jgi:ATP phosphoribosyltransferase
MSARPLRVALPKGRILTRALEIWEQIGSGISSDDLQSRRLILPSLDGRFEFLPVKNADVPTYVEAGVADLGVVGFDVLAEHDPDVLRPLDLGFGRCRLAVAGPADSPYPYLPGGVTARVATKYPEVTRRYFASRGLQAELIHIAGSVELAPLLGLTHWIVDLVETGKTLQENNLIVYENVLESSARLIVNRASHKLRLDEHQAVIAAIESVLEAPAVSSAGKGSV